MNISEYRSYVAQVRKSAINCFVGRCQVPACSANLEVHTPTFVNAIRLDNGDNPYTYQDAGWANDAGSANNRADLVATGLLRFRVLPGRHATIVLTVVMIDEGGNHSAGQDRAYRNITLNILDVNAPPYAITRVFPLLETSLQYPLILPVIPVVSPGDGERQQTTSMILTTPPGEIPPIFLNRAGPLLHTKNELQLELAQLRRSFADEYWCPCPDPPPPTDSDPIQNTSTRIPEQLGPCYCDFTESRIERLRVIHQQIQDRQVQFEGVTEALEALDQMPHGSPLLILEMHSSLEDYQRRGILHFVLAPHVSGIGQLSYLLQDDGGTWYGGQNETSVNITIVVQPVNDSPRFSLPSTLVLVEDAGFLTMQNFAQALSKGPADEMWQTLNFHVHVEEFHSVHEPVIGETGSWQSSQLFASKACKHAQQCNTGPWGYCAAKGDESTSMWLTSGQKHYPPALSAVHLTGTEESVACGGVLPQIDSDGVLRLRTARDQHGEARLWVTVRDDGGSVYGGVDAFGPVEMMLKVLPQVHSVTS